MVSVQSWMKPSKRFHRIGRTDNVCPSCEASLEKRPQRKTKCPHCDQFIYSRKRPIDEQRVLLNEEQAAIIEQDWALDYKIKESLPRELDPIWAERFELAKRTKTDPDPVVEELARKAFDEMLSLIRQGMAPRDARDKLLPPEAEDELSKKIDIRLWQLEVQSVHGTDS
jgi:hypothetical protein